MNHSCLVLSLYTLAVSRWSRVQHGFTVWDGAAYNARADLRSWEQALTAMNRIMASSEGGTAETDGGESDEPEEEETSSNGGSTGGTATTTTTSTSASMSIGAGVWSLFKVAVMVMVGMML
jgi:hypothetical protein